MPALPIDSDYLKTFLIGLLNTPSPTGFAEQAIGLVERELQRYPLAVRRTPRGSLMAEWAGAAADAPRALTAHVDTLGAMVKEIKPNGRLELTRLGGVLLPSVETEGVTIFTAGGRTVRGAYMFIEPAGHVAGARAAETVRTESNLEVRLDERTNSAAETRALGIQVGDFAAFDPRVEAGPAGFIRSRHLDDKACVACLLAAVKALCDAGLRPAQRTTLHISNYEEVLLGATSDLPPDLHELLVVDMAAVGTGQASDEFNVTLCLKDAGGPYHIEMTRKLERLAAAAEIPLVRDLYVYYTSDGMAYTRAGGAARVGLIGPGIAASHNYERTHLQALIRTAQLVVEYLRGD
jgi:putative aminopeptidase FrvX